MRTFRVELLKLRAAAARKALMASPDSPSSMSDDLAVSGLPGI